VSGKPGSAVDSSGRGKCVEKDVEKGIELEGGTGYTGKRGSVFPLLFLAGSVHLRP
jgi:hypothetical protein